MGASGIAWAYTLLSLKQQGISGKKKKLQFYSVMCLKQEYWHKLILCIIALCILWKGRWLMDILYRLSQSEVNNTIHSLSSSRHDIGTTKDVNKPEGIGFQWLMLQMPSFNPNF